MGFWESIIDSMEKMLSPLLVQPASTFFVIGVSLLLSLISLGVNRLLTDIEQFKEYNRDVREWMTSLREAEKSGDKRVYEKLKRKEARIKRLQSLVMRQRFRALLITMVPMLVIWNVLNAVFKDVTVAVLPFEAPFIGSNLTFFWWYLFCSFAASSPLTRLLGLTFEPEVKKTSAKALAKGEK